MIKSQFNRYVRDALAKRQRKSNIDEANAVIDVFVEAIKEALSENDEILLVAACFRNESGSLSSVKTGSN
jgi:nucleoid DNA-binding protein